MRNLFFACALLLSFSLFVGCSKDDGPSGAKVDGTVKVDGKTIKLKYGYAIYDGSESEYMFVDKDLLKYMGEYEDSDDVDVEYSGMSLVSERGYSSITDIFINYKVNYHRGKGTFYERAEYDAYEYLSFSDNDGKVKSSCKSIEVKGIDYDDEVFGYFDASFSVEGKVLDLEEYFGGYEEYTRSIPMTEVTDAKQIAFLKSLWHKRAN